MGGRDLTCKLCGKGFYFSNDGLYDHLKDKHKVGGRKDSQMSWDQYNELPPWWQQQLCN